MNKFIESFLILSGKINTTIDQKMLLEPDEIGQRKRRQAATNNKLPLTYNTFNYTTEQRALCGDDRACLFDFAVTGQEDLARITLETGKNFTKTVNILSKLHACV